MNTAANGAPGTPGAGGDAATIGLGGQTSGQQGAGPHHETQQETGGSGGAGLTGNQSGAAADAPEGATGATPDALPTGAVDAAFTHANPGAQDTRSDQAGLGRTGLGTPETGASQDARDLPPIRS